MTDWNMRTEDIELKDGSIVKNYHYEFNTTDKEIAKTVESHFKRIMDMKVCKEKINVYNTDICGIQQEPCEVAIIRGRCPKL